jgi:hypothetical protein
MKIRVQYDNYRAHMWSFEHPITKQWLRISSHTDPSVVPTVTDIMIRPGQLFDPRKDDVEVVK